MSTNPTGLSVDQDGWLSSIAQHDIGNDDPNTPNSGFGKGFKFPKIPGKVVAISGTWRYDDHTSSVSIAFIGTKNIRGFWV